MMEDMEMKKKVAQEIMDLMDQKDGERLKSKSPKFSAAKIEVEKEGVLDGKEEPKVEVESTEELSPEMIEKLLEMVNGN